MTGVWGWLVPVILIWLLVLLTVVTGLAVRALWRAGR